MRTASHRFRCFLPLPSVFLLAAGLLAVEPLAAAENLLRNPGFEEVGNRGPAGWRIQRWAGDGQGEPSGGRREGRGVSLSSRDGADISWTTTVAVEPQARYRLSGWIRTEDVRARGGRGALLNVHSLDGAATPVVTGTSDWRRVEVEFDAGDSDALQVNCLFGGWGLASGRAWFDDVELVMLAPGRRTPPRIEVDAAKTSEPMAAEIYSQFIEHMGRCIYGGIWAEMLEDRKFFFPVTANYNPYRALRDTPHPAIGASPWQIIGAPEGVAMSSEKPFVGKHTPVLQPGTGIRHLDLGVDAGKDYTGYIWLKSAGAGAATVEVALAWGEGDSARQKTSISGMGGDYSKHEFRFKAGGTSDKASLEIRVAGAPVAVGTVSLMPADNIEGMRADTLALLKELKAPIYRWPGGNFVSGYDWRDGIGDRDRRPPRTNPAWTGVEHNDFGMHEFIRFCRLLETEPWITVNTGFGDAHSAAAQLEYCNGPADSHWGGRRAANGAPQPWGVRYWGIGNEMWGNWQLGHMRLEHYVIKQNWVVDTMRQVDAKIICIASGDTGNDWSAGLLKGCSNHMDFIAEHFYTQERPGLAAHVRQVPDRIRQKAEWHRRARAEIPQLQGKDIRIAMTEWNYWYGPHIFGELGTRYFLKDALGIAAGLHEYARQSDIVGSAFYAQTVNVIGAIKTSRRNAAMETTGLVLKLYRQHFGEIPAATTTGGTLDAQAMWTADRKKLTLAVVNPNLTAMEVPLAVTGAKLKGTGTRWQIAGTDPQAYNDPDTAPNRVTIEESPLKGPVGRLTLAPCSVTLIAFDVE
ncbi:MAG: hypothetical protein MUF04_12605 [Akkermansiaceae bacterium]|jgi:alpha-N-arabinofuranosidase|nr:hypothetical protein [Akkermansiaceae bacterium]